MAKLLTMDNVSKNFGVVKALNGVSFDLNGGEVHALMGENGAGKSTLMNILSGGISNYTGVIEVAGNKESIHSPTDAQKLGIAKIHQELQLVPHMNVAENMHIGREISKLGFVNKKEMAKRAKTYLDALEVDIDPNSLIKDLRVGQQQMVEIAKALSMDAKILIMDEPTSALSKAETVSLFRVINKLKEQGVGIIYITHRMEEIFEIADRVTVMRDGKYIGTSAMDETDEPKIISMMVGRSIDNLYSKTANEPGAEIFRVEHLNFNPPAASFRRSLKDVSLSVSAGEVLGLAGLMGSGRSEFCECVFGVHPKRVTGDFYVNGNKVKISGPSDSIAQRISFATEDRKGQGLVLLRSIGENMSLPLLKHYSNYGFMNKGMEQVDWDKEMENLKIKAPGTYTLVSALSGGNQQKVILGRWLLTNPQLLILDEPTRGIDVGAKSEIYKLIDELSKQGMAIIVVSSDMPELIGLADRIAVFCEGRVTGEFNREEITQEKLMWAATRTEGNKNDTAV